MRSVSLDPEATDDARLGMLGERADQANKGEWATGLASGGDQEDARVLRTICLSRRANFVWRRLSRLIIFRNLSQC